MAKHIDINMAPERFVELKDEIERTDFIQEIITRGHYHDSAVSQWLEKVLEKEAEKAEPSRDVVFFIVSLLSESINEESMRTALSKLFPEKGKKLPLHDAIKNVLISALGDELREVREWALDLLIKRDEMSADDAQAVEQYLISNLEDEENPGIVREGAALTVGNMGGERAISELIAFMYEAMAEGRKGGTPEVVIMSLIKAVVYSLGRAARKMKLDQALAAWKLIDKVRVQQRGDHVEKVARWALGEIRQSITEPVLLVVAQVAVNLKIHNLIARSAGLGRAAAGSDTEDNLNVRNRAIHQTEDNEYIIDLVEFASGTVRIKMRSAAGSNQEKIRALLYLDSQERSVVECILEKGYGEGYIASIESIGEQSIDINKIKVIEVIE